MIQRFNDSDAKKIYLVENSRFTFFFNSWSNIFRKAFYAFTETVHLLIQLDAHSAFML